MRALAIAGPRATKKQVDRFQNPQAELRTLASPTAEEVTRALRDRIDAVLIFGGDGTVNRHLGQLAKSNVPVLPVAAGSGNDLARAVGMPTLETALNTWRAFIAGAARVEAIDLGMISSMSV